MIVLYKNLKNIENNICRYQIKSILYIDSNEYAFDMYNKSRNFKKNIKIFI